MALLNSVLFQAQANSTVDFTVNNAITGYQTPASAGVTTGRSYSYRAESTDLSQWEVGQGVYTTANTSLARTTILSSSTGSKINFSLPPQVGIVAVATDIVPASNTYIMFNDSDTCNTSSLLTFDKTTSRFKVGGVFDYATANILSQTISMVGANVNWDWSLGVIASVTLNVATVNFNNPTNMKIGYGMLKVAQDGSGNRGTTFTANSAWKWPGAIKPVWSTTASREDIVSVFCDGTSMYCSYIIDVR
jgi:hypothetical protein